MEDQKPSVLPDPKERKFTAFHNHGAPIQLGRNKAKKERKEMEKLLKGRNKQEWEDYYNKKKNEALKRENAAKVLAQRMKSAGIEPKNEA